MFGLPDIAATTVKVVAALAALVFGVDAVLGETKQEDGTLTLRGRRVLLGIVVSGLLTLAMAGIEAWSDAARRRQEAAQFSANIQGQERILSTALVLSDSLRQLGIMSDGILRRQVTELERISEVLTALDSARDTQGFLLGRQAALLAKEDSARARLQKIANEQRRVLDAQRIIERNTLRTLHPVRDLAIEVGLTYDMPDTAISYHDSTLALVLDDIRERAWGTVREAQQWTQDNPKAIPPWPFTWSHVVGGRVIAADHRQGAIVHLTYDTAATYLSPNDIDSLEVTNPIWSASSASELRTDSLGIWMEFVDIPDGPRALPEIALVVSGVAISRDTPLAAVTFRIDYNAHQIQVRFRTTQTQVEEARGTITSLFDLPGKELVITPPDLIRGAFPILRPTRVDMLFITMNDNRGRTIFIEGDRFSPSLDQTTFSTSIGWEDIEAYPGEFEQFYGGQR